MLNGNVYDGQWKDNQRHGHGVTVTSNKDKYDGQFQKGSIQLFFYFLDKKHGKGKYTFANGEFLDGMWKNDEFVSDVPVQHEPKDTTAHKEHVHIQDQTNPHVNHHKEHFHAKQHA